MTDNVKECQEKFRQVLKAIEPQSIVSDDTFLEKIQTYLTYSGMCFLSVFSSEFHNNHVLQTQSMATSSKMPTHWRGWREWSILLIPRLCRHNKSPISP